MKSFKQHINEGNIEHYGDKNDVIVIFANGEVVPRSRFRTPKIKDGAIIPFDPANTDYEEYLEWLSEGNTPEPADEPETE